MQSGGTTAVEDEIGHMDRLTQAQNSIDELIQIMYSTLSYLTRKASFNSVNPDLVITQTVPNADPPEVFRENTQELVTDFLRKAKQLEYLISVLPTGAQQPPADGAQAGSRDKAEGMVEDSNGASKADADELEFQELQREMLEVNEDYLAAVAEAEQLHEAIAASLRKVLDARTGAATGTA